MKYTKAIFPIFIGLLMFSVTEESMAQWFRKKKQELPNYGFHLDEGKISTQMKFKVYSNLIVVPVSIDGSDTLQFILDTGVGSVIVTDPSLKDVLDMKYVRDVLISGAGEKENITASVSVGHRFQMGDFIGYRQNIVVLNEDILELSEFLGTPIHGIFGHSLFENFVVTIDFSTLTLFISRPDKFKYRRRYGEKYPIVVTRGKPYTDAVYITDSGTKEQSLRMVIDTGAGHALLLNPNDPDIKLPEKVIHANLGRGLNGDLYGHIGRVSKVRMGKYELEDVIATFPDSVSFSMKFPPMDANRQGSIGGEFLRRFKVTLNYSDEYMALKASKKDLKQPFEHDMSGMDVRAFNSNFRRFYIKSVLAGSPADEAGLKENDEIIFVNNKSANNLTVSEIYKILSRKEGRTVEIFYRRDGQLGLTTLQLRRAI